MGLILLTGLGALLGWLAAIVVGHGSERDLSVNILTGIAGAVTAGLLVDVLNGEGNILAAYTSAQTVLIAFVASSALLASVNLLRTGELR